MTARGTDGMVAKERYERRQGVRPRHIAFSRPFPLQPLLDVVAERLNVHTTGTNRQGELYALAGIDRFQAARWFRTGLAVHTADRLATRLNLHPVLIWSDWFDVAAAEDFGADDQLDLFDCG